MDREWPLRIEFTLLLLLQLFVLGVYVDSLLGEPAHSQAPIPSGPAAANPASSRLGAFLDQYPPDKSAKLAKSQTLMRLGEGAFTGYRVFKDKKAGLIAHRARESFRAECMGLGGHFEGRVNRWDIAHHFALARQVTIDGNALSVCVDAPDIPLGALVAYSFNDRYRDSYVALFLMTRETAAEIMIIYHRAMAKELRFKAAAAERKANNEKDWVAWRSKLTIGTDTNCGPVISLRGPMIEVAHAGQATWLRREQLFPPGARDSADITIRCGSFDAL
jgi:hypothetical protein